ncbi:MAG: DUF1800 family protein [Gammaproteobacteria bacterium]|nr:DUF1800 family protein [Gammaproteobacteria bacterium]
MGSKGDRGLNENLAREILELHTLGVDGGYDQDDVIALARLISGWSVAGPEAKGAEPGEFLFRAEGHAPGTQYLLGRRYRTPAWNAGGRPCGTWPCRPSAGAASGTQAGGALRRRRPARGSGRTSGTRLARDRRGPAIGARRPAGDSRPARGTDAADPRAGGVHAGGPAWTGSARAGVGAAGPAATDAGCQRTVPIRLAAPAPDWICRRRREHWAGPNALRQRIEWAHGPGVPGCGRRRGPARAIRSACGRRERPRGPRRRVGAARELGVRWARRLLVGSPASQWR